MWRRSLWVPFTCVALAAALAACEDDGLDGIGDASAPAGDAGRSDGRDAAPAAQDAAPSTDARPGADADPASDALPSADADAAADAVSAPDADPAADALTGSDAAPGGCDGGVSSGSVSTTQSSAQISGGGPPSTVGQATVTSTGGASIQVPVSTDGSGAWAVEVPLFCGVQSILVEFPGAACSERTELTATRTGCRNPDIQVTLTWDAIGLDFELHLIRAGGRINDNATDCTWTSCINSSPDWGVLGDPTDDPHKDVDNTSTFGPENIYLSFPEPGPYTVMVEHWGVGGAGADGEVTILLAGMPPVIIPIVDLPSHFARSVATIDWPSRTVTPLTGVFDCSANWSGGCRDALP